MLRITACLALLAASFAAPVAAQSDARPTSRRVQYGDLDLSTPAGVERLHRRVRDAAFAVCRTRWPGSAIVARYNKDCVAEAIEGAAPQMAGAIDRSRRDGIIRVVRR